MIASYFILFSKKLKSISISLEELMETVNYLLSHNLNGQKTGFLVQIERKFMMIGLE